MQPVISNLKIYVRMNVYFHAFDFTQVDKRLSSKGIESYSDFPTPIAWKPMS